MSIKIASHLYRNRHGGFYFRLGIPIDLKAGVRRSEIRFSLGTEQRREAIIASLQLIGDLPRMFAELRRMTISDEPIEPGYLEQWRLQVLENAKLRLQISELKEVLEVQSDHFTTLVSRKRAEEVAKQALTLGQLRGRQALETALVFPWPAERTQPFTALLSAYLSSFEHRAYGGRKKPPGGKTLAGYEVDIRMFISVMGDVHIGAIDREVAGEYFKNLRRLPANMNRVALYRNKSVPELLAIKPPPPPQSEANASKKMERVSAMFKWALEEKRKWGIDSNPFTGFGQSSDQATPRRPFTVPELQSLLRHPSFVNRRFQNTYAYWLIPLGLFTGARLGELCQLDIKDFITVDGIPCIDINDIEAKEAVEEGGRKKRVKTKNARRLVPVHPELIRLGLLRYVELMLSRKQVHLFPELSRSRRDGPAHAASNWFQRLRKTMGMNEKQATVFHSFRHLFITSLLDGNVSPHQVAPIVGHESDLITGQVYWNKRDAASRQPTVDAFKLPQAVMDLMPLIEDVIFTPASGPRVRSLMHGARATINHINLQVHGI